MNDPLSDMLTRIRNACLVKKRFVSIVSTRLNFRIAEILEKEGFIKNFEIKNQTEFQKFSTSSKIISKQFQNVPVKEKKQIDNQNIKEFKIYLKYYKRFQKKYYQLDRIKNPKLLKKLVYLIKILKKKKSSQKCSCITNLRRISKPGLRIYVNTKELPKVLGGAGIAIVSTSKGILTDREARFYGVGGEVLCSVW